MYTAMWNLPGHPPKMTPQTFNTFDAAQAFILLELATLADEGSAEANRAIVPVAQERVPFAYQVDGYAYSVEHS